MASANVAKLKKKKKKWSAIVAPGFFGNRVLGEASVYESSQLKDKCITANFMTITNDMKKQHLNLVFRVVDIKEGKAHTEVYRYYIIPSLLKRFVRKGRNKIDDSFIVKTKDERFVRIKPMLITNAATHYDVVSNLRTTTRRLIQSVVSTYTYEQLVEEVVTYKLQKFLRDHLHKIYPLKICEIRDFKMLDTPPLKFATETTELTEILKQSRLKRKGKKTEDTPSKKGKDEESEETESTEEVVVEEQ